jgi:hypothetical protein
LIFGEFSFYEHPVYFIYQSLVWCVASKDFLPFCGWSLQFTDHFSSCAEAF